MSEEGSFFAASSFTRFLIFLAGPLSSLLLTFLLFLAAGLIPVETISNPARIVLTEDYESVYHTAARQEDLRTGDLILSVDDVEVTSWEMLERYISDHKGETFALRVLRDGETREAVITPGENGVYGLTLYLEPVIGRAEENPYWAEGDMIISIDGNEINNTNDFYLYYHEGALVRLLRDGEEVVFTAASGRLPFAWKNNIEVRRSSTLKSAVPDGLEKTKEILLSVFSSLKSGDSSGFTGPAHAAQSIGSITLTGLETSALSGLHAALYLMAIVSISLFVANILPIPSFDGGQMLLNVINMIRRKGLTPRQYVVYQASGLAATALILISMYSSEIIQFFS